MKWLAGWLCASETGDRRPSLSLSHICILSSQPKKAYTELRSLARGNTHSVGVGEEWRGGRGGEGALLARDKCQKNLTMRSPIRFVYSSIYCGSYDGSIFRFSHLSHTLFVFLFYASRNVLCVCLF